MNKGLDELFLDITKRKYDSITSADGWMPLEVWMSLWMSGFVERHPWLWDVRLVYISTLWLRKRGPVYYIGRYVRVYVCVFAYILGTGEATVSKFLV